MKLKNKWNWTLMFISTALSTVIVTGCTAVSLRQNNTIKLGVIAPLTGDLEAYGQDVNNGIELAVENYNQQGGILGRKIETVMYDDKGEAEEAKKAFEKLKNDDKVDAVIGGVISSTALAIAPLSNNYNLPMISPSATNPDVTKGSKTVFRICSTDLYQGRGLAQFTYDRLNARKAAVMYNMEDDYSSGLADAIKNTFEAEGGIIANYEGYTKDTKDFGSILQKIRLNNPDVLFIPDYYYTVVQIIDQIHDLEIEAQLVGGDGWVGWSTLEKGKELFEGGYFSDYYAVDDPTVQNKNFVRAYEKKYNKSPNSLAALSYDAVVVILEAIKIAGTTEPNEVIEWLEQTHLNGVTGPISFDRMHNPHKVLYIFRIQQGSNLLIQKIRPQ